MFKVVAISAKRKPVSVRVGLYTELADDRAQRLGVCSKELSMIDDIKRMLSLGRRINAGGKEAVVLYRLTQTHGTSVYLGVLATRLYQAERKTYPTLEAALTTLKSTRDTLMQVTQEDFRTLFENFIAPDRIVAAIWRTLEIEEGASVPIDGVLRGLKARVSEFVGHSDSWVNPAVVIQAVAHWVTRIETVEKTLAESVYKRKHVSKVDVDKLLERQDIFQAKAHRDEVLEAIWGVFLQQSTTNVLIPMSKIEAQWKAAIPLLDSYLQHYYASKLEKSSVALTKWVHSENLDRHRLDLYSARVSAEKAVPYRENESQTLLNEFRQVFRNRLISFKVPEQYAPQIEWELARLRPRTKASDVLSFDDSMISQAFCNIVLNEALATSTLTPLYQGLSKEWLDRSSLQLSRHGSECVITLASVKRQLDTFVNSISYIPTFQKQGIRDEELGKVIRLKTSYGSPYKSDQSIITDIICSRRSDMQPFREIAVAYKGGVTQELFERFEAYATFKLNVIELSTVMFVLPQDSKSPSEVVDELRQKQKSYRDALAESDLFHKHGLIGEQAAFAQILAKAVSKLPFLNPKPIVTALVEWVKQTYEQDQKMRWAAWEAFGVQSEDLPILEEKMQAKPSNSGYRTCNVSQGDAYSVVSKPLYDLFFEQHNIPGRSALFNGVSKQYKASFDLGYGALLPAISNLVIEECKRVLDTDTSYGPWGGRWFFEQTNPLLIYGQDPKNAYKNSLKTSSSSQLMAFQRVYFKHEQEHTQALSKLFTKIPEGIKDDFTCTYQLNTKLHTPARIKSFWDSYKKPYYDKLNELTVSLTQAQAANLTEYLRAYPLNKLDAEAHAWVTSVRVGILTELGASGSLSEGRHTQEIGELNRVLPYPSIDVNQLRTELLALRTRKAEERAAEINKFLLPLSAAHQEELRPKLDSFETEKIQKWAMEWAQNKRRQILNEWIDDYNWVRKINQTLPYPSVEWEELMAVVEAKKVEEIDIYVKPLCNAHRKQLRPLLEALPLDKIEANAKGWAKKLRRRLFERLDESKSHCKGEIDILNNKMPYPSLNKEDLTEALKSLKQEKEIAARRRREAEAAEAKLVRDAEIAEQARLRAEINKFLTPLSTPHQNQLRPLITYLPITEIKAKAESWANGVREGMLRELGCTNTSEIASLNRILPYPSLDREGLRGAWDSLKESEARRLREIEANRVKAEEARRVREIEEARVKEDEVRRVQALEEIRLQKLERQQCEKDRWKDELIDVYVPVEGPHPDGNWILKKVRRGDYY